MPVFKTETVLSILGPQYPLVSQPEIYEFLREFAGGPEDIEKVAHHVLKHCRQPLITYVIHGRQMYGVLNENKKKFLSWIHKTFGKELIVPRPRNICTTVFENLTDLNNFQQKELMPKDVIGIQFTATDPGTSTLILTYWKHCLL